jgi:hypothetical protein
MCNNASASKRIVTSSLIPLRLRRPSIAVSAEDMPEPKDFEYQQLLEHAIINTAVAAAGRTLVLVYLDERLAHHLQRRL